MDLVILMPIFGIIFGCGIALLSVWTEHRRDIALIVVYSITREKEITPKD